MTALRLTDYLLSRSKSICLSNGQTFTSFSGDTPLTTLNPLSTCGPSLTAADNCVRNVYVYRPVPSFPCSRALYSYPAWAQDGQRSVPNIYQFHQRHLKRRRCRHLQRLQLHHHWLGRRPHFFGLHLAKRLGRTRILRWPRLRSFCFRHPERDHRVVLQLRCFRKPIFFKFDKRESLSRVAVYGSCFGDVHFVVSIARCLVVGSNVYAKAFVLLGLHMELVGAQ